MKLWLIRQNVNNGYDTYDSAVMAANTEDEARVMIPGHGGHDEWGKNHWAHHSWVKEESDVIVQYIGEAADGTEKGQIIASFNAG